MKVHSVEGSVASVATAAACSCAGRFGLASVVPRHYEWWSLAFAAAVTVAFAGERAYVAATRRKPKKKLS